MRRRLDTVEGVEDHHDEADRRHDENVQRQIDTPIERKKMKAAVQKFPAVQPQPVAGDSAGLMAMINRAATDPAFDVTKLESLLAVKERWEANEARKAFVVALGNFKASPPAILKNKHVEFGTTKFDHATLDQVSDTVGKALSVHGLSHRWDIEQEASVIKVTCVLTHVLGHSERVPMQASADTSGSKNPIQAIGSTVTYLQRYTLLAAAGVAVKGQDNDGAGADPVLGLDEGLVADHLAAIEACADVPSLQKAFAAAYTLAQKAKDKPSMRQFTEAKDVRKKALGVKS